MKLGLKNKFVLITAANGGLGPDISKSFYQEGANLILISKNEGKLNELKEEIITKSRFSRDIKILPLDLQSKDSPNIINEFLDKNKITPDIIVHHLGGTLNIKTSCCSYEEWQQVLWFNVLFSSELNRLLLPKMVEKKWSRIVHISSISASSLRGSGPYSSSKAFLEAYVTTLAREYAKTSVVISSVSPGALLIKNGPWDHNYKNRPEMVDDFLRHHHASGRLGMAKEIVPFILLLSSELCTFSQGTNCNIDGGTM